MPSDCFRRFPYEAPLATPPDHHLTSQDTAPIAAPVVSACKQEMGTVILARRAEALLVFLLLVLLGSPGESSETLECSMLSNAIQELAEDLGLKKMQVNLVLGLSRLQ